MSTRALQGAQHLNPAGHLLRVLSAPWRVARYAWVRSLQARVVMGTLVLCALVTALVGWMLMRQIADGLVEDKRDQSVAQAQAGITDAQQQLDASVASDTDSQSQVVRQLVTSLSSRTGSPPGYELVLEGPLGPGAGTPSQDAGLYTTPEGSPDSIPVDLRTTVETQPGTWWSYSRLVSDDGTSDPAIVVGSRLRLTSTGEAYSLFYLFPMDDQQDTLWLVRRGLISAGLALMVLVAAVAGLVTRQVVTPVRLARRIAERLAAGRLEERMQVRGEDDLARLGLSFNQMAASLQRQIRQLEELSRVQRRFASDVSHELRTPLTTVRMAADVLHDSKTDFDPATARSAELLQAELDRFESLLTDLLEISRFDAGAARLSVETVDLVDIARRVANAYRGIAGRQDVRLEVVADQEACLVEADVRRIERIVRNLVANAINYSRSAAVQIRVRGTDDAAALVVRDWGIGLRPGESSLVFNRFWRADPARARNTGGSGLGLAIALEDACLHGGWLQAWGEPGKGAQFRLTLPTTCGQEPMRSPLPLVPPDSVSAEVDTARHRVGAGVAER